MSDQLTMVQNIKGKLDELPLEFPITDTTIIASLKDAMREMKITDLLAISDPNTELYIEIRAEWWQLHRVRNSTAINFRYTTGSDGRSVDKSMIPKMINTIMSDLDAEYKKWYKMTYSKTTGKIWTRDVVASETLAGM